MDTSDTELVSRWCAMWSGDSSLAADLVTPDARHWSGEADVAQEVDGAEDQAAYAGRRGGHGSVRPRVVADGGDAVAFLWDATGPDGSTRTGLDVLALVGGKVQQSWTFVAAQHGDPTDPDQGDDTEGPVDESALRALAGAWLAVWTGEQQPADVVTDDFVAWSGAGDADRGRHGVEALEAHVSAGRDGRDALSVSGHGDPVLDVDRQRVALLWSVTEQREGGEVEVGGVDLLAVRGGRVSRSWTLRGTRPFAF